MDDKKTKKEIEAERRLAQQEKARKEKAWARLIKTAKPIK
jgi:hypothetical protein